MFAKILYISDNIAHVENLAGNNITGDLMNLHVIFEASDQRILGEIIELNKDIIKIRFLGEFSGKRYLNGVLRKPILNSTIRIINGEELLELVGSYNSDSFILGTSAIYKNFKVCPSINSLFSNHLAIFGNSGSGKSCGVARIVQNIFTNNLLNPYNANLFIFDAYGEYKNAFGSINNINDKFLYKFITTNKQEENDVELNIPVHLLSLDDSLSLCDFNKFVNFDNGHPEWGDTNNKELSKAARLWPHKINGEGHFVCLVKKAGESHSYLKKGKRKSFGVFY